MAHWENLTVDDEFQITGRGTTLVVSLKKNGFTDSTWSLSASPIKVGDTMSYLNRIYTITGIEGFRNLLNGASSYLVGLVVKENI